MDASESFSSSYAEARKKFCTEARAAGAVLETLELGAKGPDGEDLRTDVALFGRPTAERILVLISGTHGVEGFCGSGAQIDFIRRGETARLPKNVSVLMIHAINPYGFAWRRRVTEENVDLNRNWIDFDRPLPKNEGYRMLSPAICPSEWSEAARAESAAAISAYQAREGELSARLAILGGQYEFPAGLFYGGLSPSWSRRTQTAIFDHFLGKAEAVGVIDYHTALGPWGYGEQITVVPAVSDGYARALRWYGAAVTSTAGGTSSAANVVGDGLSAAVALLPAAEVTVLALEFGTVPLLDMIVALQADAWLHAHGDPASPKGAEIKRQMRTAFYGDRADWKGMVAGQSLLCCRQALKGLAEKLG